MVNWPKLSETLGGVKSPDRCQCCSAHFVDLTRWREHDEADRPTNVVVVLCKACSRRLIGPHPRLYGEMGEKDHHPGTMGLCVLCRHREGVSCPMALFNGGPGVGIAPAPSRVHIRSSDRRLSGLRLHYWQAPSSCTERVVLAIAGEGGVDG